MACSHGVHDVPLLFDIAFGVGILGRAKKPVDKTGTLTEDGLDVLGARIVTRGKRFVCFRVRSLSFCEGSSFIETNNVQLSSHIDPGLMY
jgi:hypothetical protein